MSKGDLYVLKRGRKSRNGAPLMWSRFVFQYTHFDSPRVYSTVSRGFTKRWYLANFFHIDLADFYIFFILLVQRWGSVTFWCGSGSSDPYLWLMDPDPTPDPTPFFIDCQDAKKKKSDFFSYNLPQAHHLQSKKIDFLPTFCGKILQALFQTAQHISEKREGPGAGSGPAPLTTGSGSRGPKNMRILRIRIRFRIPNTAFVLIFSGPASPVCCRCVPSLLCSPRSVFPFLLRPVRDSNKW